MICSGSVIAAVHLEGCYLGSQRAQDCWIQTRLGTPADHEVAYERWWEEELEIECQQCEGRSLCDIQHGTCIAGEPASCSVDDAELTLGDA